MYIIVVNYALGIININETIDDRTSEYWQLTYTKWNVRRSLSNGEKHCMF